jgi:hypothetical protein
MRLLYLTLMTAAVAASVAIAASSPAAAIQTCKCNDILMSSGFCTEWTCGPGPEMSVSTFKSIRSARECRKSQVLVCDYGACKVVCDPSKK